MKLTPLHPPANTSRPKAFTLVELLVTITIIVVIASLSFGAYSKWLKQARLTASVTQVRGFSAMIMSYAADNSELPVWHDYNKSKYWWELLMEAEGLTDAGIFKSPSDKKFDIKNVAETISYGWNYPVIGRHKGDGGYRTDHVLRINNFPAPDRTLVLADGPAENCWGFINSDTNQPDPERYDGKVAGLLLDGSARVMKTPEEFQPDSQWFIPIKEMIQK